MAGKGNVSPLTSFLLPERALSKKKREASVVLKARFLEKAGCSGKSAGLDAGDPCSVLPRY